MSVRFWMLGVAILLVSTVVNSMVVRAVALLTEHGCSRAAAAGLTAAVGPSTMAGRLLMEFLVNFIFAPYVTAFFFLLPCIRDTRLHGDRLSEWTPSTITKT
jgi:hypothetical protein